MPLWRANYLTPDIMKPSLPVAKINGIAVNGQAHIQPGVNNWIGVCIVEENILDIDFEKPESIVIEYEGTFNCRKFQTKGKGKAKVLAVTPVPQANKITITFEGINEPELERDLKKDLSHSYDENLPAYINKKDRLIKTK